MSSGVQRTITGSATGTGASLDIDTIGFLPRSVTVWNQSGLATIHWQDTMADASGYKAITAGTHTFITTLGITPRPKGFRFGADTDLNVAGEIFHYEARE